MLPVPLRRNGYLLRTDHAFATEQTKLGLMENTDSLQQTIDFCASFSQVQADHLLLTSFDDRIKNAAFLDEAEKASYISRNQSIIYDVVLPSYLSLSNQLSSIIDKTDDNGSLSVKEKGRTYYALLVRKKHRHKGKSLYGFPRNRCQTSGRPVPNG